jgi:hypothetical protein
MITKAKSAQTQTQRNAKRTFLRRIPFLGLLALIVMMLGLPGALTNVRAGSNQEQRERKEKEKEKVQKETSENQSSQEASKKAKPEDDEDEGEDPDLPAFAKGLIDKETFHARRSEQIDLWRGVEPGKPFDVTARSRAIQLSEEKNGPSSPSVATWTQIGPAPIPLGQTQTTRVNVSGRTTCMAIDPTNGNRIYVGTAQGGVYRSLDGGTTWLAIFDSAQSLAIGALTLVPGDPTTLYVGTGEANGSADSFGGVGIYRINNVTTLPALTGPINPVRNYIDADGVTPRSVPIFNGRSISKILVQPGQPGSLLVGVAGGVIGLGGDAPFGNTLPPLSMRGLYRVNNADGPIAGVTGERIKVTTAPAAGTCFDSPCTGNRNINDLVYDTTDATGNTVVAWMNGLNTSGDGGIYRSTNVWTSPATSVIFTQTFITTATSTSNARGTLVGFQRGGATVIYVASGEPSAPGTICNSAANPGALRVSTDGGLTWSAKLQGGGGFCAGQCFYNIGLAVTPGAAQANDTVYVAGNVRSTSCAKLLGKSTDGGATTFANMDVTLHADTHFVAIDPSNPSILYHGNDGGIWKSTDAAVTWTTLNNTGFHATQFQSIAVHPTDRFITIGGTQDNGTEQMNASFVWTHADDGDGGFAMIDQSTPTTMYHTFFNQAGTQIGYSRSLTGGTLGSWSFLGCSGTGTTNGIACNPATTTAVNFYCPTALGPGSPNNTVYIGTDRLLRSDMQGLANATVSQAPLTSGVPVSAIGISPQDDNVRMVGQNNGALWYTTTGSTTLTSLDPVGAGSVIPDKYVARCVFDPTNKNTVYISLGGFTGGTSSAQSHVWKVTNLSTTPVITAINTGLPDVPVNGFVVDPMNTTQLFAGTDIGVYQWTNSVATWTAFGAGLPRVAVFDMQIAQPGTANEFLRIATHGRGMWEIPLVPTLAKVIDTRATAYDDGQVLLAWKTGNETDNLGFNVYREQDGQRIRITPQIVAGSALMTGPGPSLEAGHSYCWSDAPPDGSRKVKYWIEDIDLGGHSNWTGPIEAKFSVGKRSATGRNAMLLSALGLHNTQMTVGVGTAPAPRVAETPKFSLEASKLQTNLAGQAAVKIAVKQEGWYRVSQPELAAAGLSAKSDSRNLQLFADGRELPMNVLTASDGSLSAVEFYGVGLDTAATNTRLYWLINGSQPGKRIPSVAGKGAGIGSGSFSYTVERKDRTIYFSNLRNGEAENFFGPVVARDGIDQMINLSRVVPTTENAVLEVAVQGVTRKSHEVAVSLNGAALGTISFANQARGVAQFAVPQSKLKEGDNAVRLVSQGDEGDISLLDVIRLTYQRAFTADANLLRMSVNGGQLVSIDGFSSSSVRMVDVTDAGNPQELAATVRPGKNGYTISALVSGAGQRRVLAFGDSAVSQAASVTANQPSNWRRPAAAADMILLTRRDWFNAVEPLRALRQSQGLSVAVVDIDDVYDEFSFGNKTPQAIKDFILYARTTWKKAPRFALIVGDASYDPKDFLGFGDNDVVPTSLIDTQFIETSCDDCLADSNLDGVGEIAIGRLPARNLTEVTRMISKLVDYDGTTASDEILLVSDTTDSYNFEASTTKLRNIIPASFKIEEIDRGRLDPATAKTRLLDGINRGQKIVAYSGHGNAEQWRGDLLTTADARSLTNEQGLAVFVAMTCLNGYFHDAMSDSLAESLMKAEHGGAVAVWASSGMTSPNGQEMLDQQMLKGIFESGSGKHLTLGEAVLRAKAMTADPDVRRTWILFGDPSMRIK